MFAKYTTEKIMSIHLEKINDYKWRIPKTGNMRVDGIIYASEKLLQISASDNAYQQVANVACLPGIIKNSMAMPDIHWGYGFCIGGVAAFDYDEGIISPGGVGYDINCGVRLMRTNLRLEEVKPKIKELMASLFSRIPCGVGSSGAIKKLSKEEEKKVMQKGARWAIESGFGSQDDLERIEENGNLSGSNPDFVSDKAYERGRDQMGTLGSGNHFIEVDVVEEVYDEKIAFKFGLKKGNVAVLMHSGSRGFGYQVCDDYLKIILSESRQFGITLPDKQLACVPITSLPGKQYYSAMVSAANYAYANRQVMGHLAKEVFEKFFDISPRDLNMVLVYDVAHNIAKIEEHEIDGKKMKLCVHRKGATRSFPAGHPYVPEIYKEVGQPVLIPGDMGRCSFVLVGTQKALTETFGSTCHGAGRLLSRTQAVKESRGRSIKKELEDAGIYLVAKDGETVAEEMPSAYKNVEDVVETVDLAGLSKKVAKLKPLGVIKG